MYEKFFKRFLDIFLCSIALVILLPIFLIAAIGIRFSSRGHLFYYSKRAGLNGAPFRFYKFRSMHITSQRKDLFIADADRVFPFGKFMRRLKVDELPQLINVIKGDMSIVGPRPMEVSSVDRIYSGKYKKILSVKPGLTSAASLFDYTVGEQYNNDEAYRIDVLPYKLEMELYYVKNQSFVYDIQLIFRTILIIIQVLFGKKVFREQPEYLIINKIS